MKIFSDWVPSEKRWMAFRKSLVLTSAEIKCAGALILSLGLASLVSGCGRHGPVELPPGAQDTKQGEATMRTIYPEPTPARDASGAAVSTFTNSNQTPSAPSAQPPANVKPALPNLNKTFVLDPLL
jgi:predicted small lipoprotein YifL